MAVFFLVFVVFESLNFKSFTLHTKAARATILVSSQPSLFKNNCAIKFPTFNWKGCEGTIHEINGNLKINKMFETAQKVFERRHLNLEDVDKKILKKIFDETASQRVEKV